MEDEAVAVRGEDERDVEDLGVLQRLLHAVADRVVVVLRLDDRDRDVGLVVEDVVRELRLPPGHHLAADVDLPFVKWTSRRICVCSSHPAPMTAGVMNFAQMSASLRSFLFISRSRTTSRGGHELERAHRSALRSGLCSVGIADFGLAQPFRSRPCIVAIPAFAWLHDPIRGKTGRSRRMPWRPSARPRVGAVVGSGDGVRPRGR